MSAKPPWAEASDPGSPVARLQQAAKRANDEGDMVLAAKMAKAAENLQKYEIQPVLKVTKEHADLSQRQIRRTEKAVSEANADAVKSREALARSRQTMARIDKMLNG